MVVPVVVAGGKRRPVQGMRVAGARRPGVLPGRKRMPGERWGAAPAFAGFVSGSDFRSFQLRSKSLCLDLNNHAAMPVTIRFRCYYCHRVHTVDETAAGKRGRCTCGKLMLVPAAGRGGALDGDDAPDTLPVAVPPAVELAVDGDGLQGTADLPLTRDPARPESGRAALARGPTPGISAGVGVVALAASTPAPAPAPRAASERSAAAAGLTSADGGRPSGPVRRAGPPPERKGTSAMNGTIYLLLAVPVLGAWIFHQFFTSERDLLGLGSNIDPNYLNLPAALWSTLLAALFLALVFEGLHRLRRARES
jgi:hypothetical protein